MEIRQLKIITGGGSEPDKEPAGVLVRFSGKSFVVNYQYSKDNEEIMDQVLPTFRFD